MYEKISVTKKFPYVTRIRNIYKQVEKRLLACFLKNTVTVIPM